MSGQLCVRVCLQAVRCSGTRAETLANDILCQILLEDIAVSVLSLLLSHTLAGVSPRESGGEREKVREGPLLHAVSTIWS